MFYSCHVICHVICHHMSYVMSNMSYRHISCHVIFHIICHVMLCDISCQICHISWHISCPGASSCLIKCLRPKDLINFSDLENGADFKNPFLTYRGRGKGGKI